jgi:8-oxo-dGTP diphosphatase
MKQAPKQFRFAAVAVDVVVFGFDPAGVLCVLTDVVNRPPHYVHMRGFPGGMVTATENTDEAAARVLREKVALDPAYLEQLYTFSAITRDTRNRVVSVAHLGCVRPETVAQYEHPTATFLPVREAKKLAYDHDEMLLVASRRLAAKCSYTTIAQYLLPKYFTLTQLQDVYEAVTAQSYDKRNFRKKILALEVIKDTGRKEEGVQNRPAALYTFVKQKLTELPLGF